MVNLLRIWVVNLSVFSTLIKDSSLFSNVSAGKDSWLSCGAGISGVSYTFVISQRYARIELTISGSSKDVNKRYFKKLLANKESIETTFGDQLEWEELPDSKMSRIKYELDNVSLYDKSTWEQMKMFLINNLPKFEKAFKPFVLELN